MRVNSKFCAGMRAGISMKCMGISADCRFSVFQMNDVLYAYTGDSLLQVHNAYTVEKPQVSHVIERMRGERSCESLELLCRVDTPSLEPASFKWGLVRFARKMHVEAATVSCVVGALGAITDHTQHRVAIDSRTHCFISFLHEDSLLPTQQLQGYIQGYATAVFDISVEALGAILRNNKLILFEREELQTLARNSTEAWARPRRIGSRDNFFALTECNAVALGVQVEPIVISSRELWPSGPLDPSSVT